MEKTNLTKEIISERYAVFNAAKTKLKNDFYGLDSVIEEIFKSIETWYIYPEYLMRPCIINLWGLTGVGKTDLVKKLRTYLKIDKFVATEMDNTSNSFEDVNKYGYVENSRTKSIYDLLTQFDITPNDKSILLLDEIHRYRTISNEGKQFTKTRFNDVWRLLSDGALFDSSNAIFRINEAIASIESKYDNIRISLSGRAKTFDEKMSFLIGNPVIDEKEVEKEKEESMKLIKTQGFVPYEFRKNLVSELENFNIAASGNNLAPLMSLIKIDDEDRNKLRLLKMIYQGSQDAMLNEIFVTFAPNNESEDNRIRKYISNCSNKVLLEWLKFKRDRMLEEVSKMTEIELRKENARYVYNNMLIFICGNLCKSTYEDKDFTITNELNKLFRPEQISRFGSSHIIYPILSKEDYDKIIYREIELTKVRLRDEYSTDKIDFKVEEIYKKVINELPDDYLYSGVRPIYSAVQRAMSDEIPKMLINIFQ
ncbi:MAG: AAA family ATPase [Anaeroplasmataceae bacterium]